MGGWGWLGESGPLRNVYTMKLHAAFGNPGQVVVRSLLTFGALPYNLLSLLRVSAASDSESSPQ